MTEIKISDEEIEKLAEQLFERDHKDDGALYYYPWAQAPILMRQDYTRNARAALEVLVASGWRREEDVLREAAEQLDSLLGAAMLTGQENAGIDAYSGAAQVVDWLKGRASGTGQYVFRRGVAVVPDDLRTVLDQRVQHSHDRPGVWNSDNRPGLANTACVECAARVRLWEALRASEAEQYVSAGTRTDEDQRRDDEEVCSKCGSASCVADKRASAEWDGHV